MLEKEVVKKIEDIRDKLWLSQADVCEVLGIRQSHYSQLITSRKGKITIEVIEKFCTAYKVNPQWLFGNDVRVFTSDDLENTVGKKLKKVK